METKTHLEKIADLIYNLVQESTNEPLTSIDYHDIINNYLDEYNLDIMEISEEELDACGYKGKRWPTPRSECMFCCQCGQPYTEEYYGMFECRKHKGSGTCYDCAVGDNPKPDYCMKDSKH